MARVAVLHTNPRVTWTSRRILDALARKGMEAHYVLWENLTLRIEYGERCRVWYRGKCGFFDAVIVRGIGRSLTPEKLVYRYTMLEALEADGVVVVNPSSAIQAARNKASSTLKLVECGIPVPTVHVAETPSAALRAIRETGRAVIKPIMGSLGLGSFLVDNVDIAYYIVNILAELNQPIYIQRYIDKKYERDIRVFIVGDKPVAAIYRYATHWKSNIAQGARPEPAEINDQIARMALDSAKCLGLLYAGVDIVEAHDGALYVLEANASPLWRGLYRATGVDPSGHIADLVYALVKR